MNRETQDTPSCGKVYTRSCAACHSKKTRCDRQQPCSSCSLAKLPCHFPPDGRMRPTSEGDHGGLEYLTSRLDKLEDSVQKLYGERSAIDQAINSRAFAQPYAYLLLDDGGRARYLHSAFWQCINTELQLYLQAHTDTIPNAKDERLLVAQQGGPHLQASCFYATAPLFMMPFSVSRDPEAGNFSSFHPASPQVLQLWQVYKTNVDPVAKMIHIPVMDAIVKNATMDLNDMPAAIVGLLFVIYYGSVTSMSESEVLGTMGTSKQLLLDFYARATEHALTKAGWISQPDFVAFQAALLLLTFLRANGDSRYSGMLVSLLVRLSEALGLHRDGANLRDISPYRAELQRRAFWHLIVLDRRSAEELGMDPVIKIGSYDTAPPLNLEDDDLTALPSCLPPARRGVTNMSASLIRIKTIQTSDKVYAMLSRLSNNKAQYQDDHLVEQRCSAEWDSCYNDICEDHICGEPADLRRLCESMARMNVAKLRLMTRCLVPGAIITTPPTRKPTTDMGCITELTEMLEYNHVVNQDKLLSRWNWIFAAYTRWHITCFLMIQLLRCPWSSLSERAWKAIHDLVQDAKPGELECATQRTIMIIPFQRLYGLVAAHRAAEIERLKGDVLAALELNAIQYPVGPNVFDLPVQETSAKARAQWQELVLFPTHGDALDADQQQAWYDRLFDVIMDNNGS